MESVSARRTKQNFRKGPKVGLAVLLPGRTGMGRCNPRGVLFDYWISSETVVGLGRVEYGIPELWVSVVEF